jgi:predicted naringenin-chalcone synthase
MSFAVLGLGTAVPEHALSQARAADVAKVFSGLTEADSDSIANLYRHTGIETRHVIFDAGFVADVLDGNPATPDVFQPKRHVDDRGPRTRERMLRYQAEALPLSVRAARAALEEAAYRPGDITHLVLVSCTGFAAPGVDFGLVQELGLSARVTRTNLGFMGCHGAINGLRVAQAFAESDPSAQVLLCAVELCTLHLYYGWNPRKVVANALFADGAAAVAGAAHHPPTPPTWRVAATGSCLFPQSAYAMTWTIGDHGFEMSLSTKVPGLIAENLPAWLASWLADQGLRPAQVATWAVHPGGPRILSAVQESLHLPASTLAASYEVLAECGNMSSPTLLFIVQRLRRRQAPLPCVALGFGPGLVVEAMLFR